MRQPTGASMLFSREQFNNFRINVELSFEVQMSFSIITSSLMNRLVNRLRRQRSIMSTILSTRITKRTFTTRNFIRGTSVSIMMTFRFNSSLPRNIILRTRTTISPISQPINQEFINRTRNTNPNVRRRLLQKTRTRNNLLITQDMNLSHSFRRSNNSTIITIIITSIRTNTRRLSIRSINQSSRKHLDIILRLRVNFTIRLRTTFTQGRQDSMLSTTNKIRPSLNTIKRRRLQAFTRVNSSNRKLHGTFKGQRNNGTPNRRGRHRNNDNNNTSHSTPRKSATSNIRTTLRLARQALSISANHVISAIISVWCMVGLPGRFTINNQHIMPHFSNHNLHDVRFTSRMNYRCFFTSLWVHRLFTGLCDGAVHQREVLGKVRGG